jgi:pyruvate,orthophosphate dikinase
MNKKLVFSFAEGDGKNKKLLGGKGANLCEMTQIGLNVPPGFVITTEACLDYLQAKEISGGVDGSYPRRDRELGGNGGKDLRGCR